MKVIPDDPDVEWQWRFDSFASAMIRFSMLGLKHLQSRGVFLRFLGKYDGALDRGICNVTTIKACIIVTAVLAHSKKATSEALPEDRCNAKGSNTFCYFSPPLGFNF